MFALLKKHTGVADPPHTHFLVALAKLSVRYKDGQLVFTPDAGRVAALGFADGNSRIISTAPSSEPAVKGSFYTDKFINFAASGSRRLGFVEIKEDYVYDEQYRCDIDFTGLRLTLNLSFGDLDKYRDFIGNHVMPELTDKVMWDGRVLLRMPSPMFSFPRGRGSPPPYPPARTSRVKVGTLRSIKKLPLASLMISKVGPNDLSHRDLGAHLHNIGEGDTLHIGSLEG